MHQFSSPSIFYQIVCPIPIQNNMHYWWIEKRKDLKTIFMIIFEIFQKEPFDIITMTPTGTLGLCCARIAQLMTHPAVYTLPFTLQLCYKLLGILQKVTKSQMVHISSHDGLQNFITSKLLTTGSRVCQSGDTVTEICPSLTKY